MAARSGNTARERLIGVADVWGCARAMFALKRFIVAREMRAARAGAGAILTLNRLVSMDWRGR